MIAEHYARKWQAAGLIDAATARAILDWQAAHRRPVWLWAVAGTGTLAIGLGVIAIVGANWDDIPDTLKLAVDLALNALCAAAVFVWWRRQRAWPREIAALLLFGLVLSGIALIGQVYQLQSEPWHALALWLALCTPFLALTTFGRLAAILWALVAVVTWFSASEDVARFFVKLAVLERHRSAWDNPFLMALLTYLPACGLIAAASLRRLWAPARRQADQILHLGIAGLIAACSLVSAISWLSRSDSAAFGPIAVAALATLVAVAALWFAWPPAERRVGTLLLAVSFAVWVAALLMAHLGGHVLLPSLEGRTADLAHALLFIVYWAILGGMAARAGWRGLFGLAFTMIGLRLLLLYFEAIGGLTATGIGLMGGGVLCLVLAAVGWRLTRRVPRRSAGATP
ncbi:MAG: DUF2157 domain-containing protein [Proteobacteria bacterium]|nr:DUF2157 domain-containing protein [Pseudomonadota bacterium]